MSKSFFVLGHIFHRCALLFFSALLVGGCQTKPIEELTLADVAVRAAQKAKADSLAPDAFRKAENNFLRAKKDYVDGYYDSCRKHATEARLLAEKAEFQALYRQQKVKGKAGGRGTSSEDVPDFEAAP